MKGESFEACLHPRHPALLKRVKKIAFPLDVARDIASDAIVEIDEACKEYFEKTPKEVNENTEFLLNAIQYDIMKIALMEEAERDEWFD